MSRSIWSLSRLSIDTLMCLVTPPKSHTPLRLHKLNSRENSELWVTSGGAMSDHQINSKYKLLCVASVFLELYIFASSVALETSSSKSVRIISQRSRRTSKWQNRRRRTCTRKSSCWRKLSSPLALALHLEESWKGGYIRDSSVLYILGGEGNLPFIHNLLPSICSVLPTFLFKWCYFWSLWIL